VRPAPSPRRVIEAGGGYGAFAYAYCSESPDTAYCIVDLAEMLALQYFFLSLAFPERHVRWCLSPESVTPRPGEILLVPLPLAWSGLQGELFFSTFALSEMPVELQRRVAERDFFRCDAALIAGQLPDEAPEKRWAPHDELIGRIVGRFEDVRIERFHIGKNYLLRAFRKKTAVDGCRD
jgi:hypothetical protein